MRDRRGGFILVSALAILAILAALVGGAAALARASIADANLLRERLTQDALAHAGLELAAYQAFALRRPIPDLIEQRFRLDAGVVTLTVTAESGRVDLNGADAELLAGLWRAAGQTSLSPEAFANRVVDWRDPDSKREKDGAERSEYDAAGAPGPANAPFQTVDDLQHVLGVGPDAARTLKPYLTVGNPDGKVSAMTAPLEVLRAIPKMNAAVASRILALQRGGSAAAAKMQDALSAANVTAETVTGPALQVRVVVKGASKSSVGVFSIFQGDATALYRTSAFEEKPVR